MNNLYRYAVEFVGGDSDVLGQDWLDVNWAPALEWTRFRAFRDRRSFRDSNHGWCATEAAIRPTPHAELGFPRCIGFRVTVEHGGVRFEEDFSSEFFGVAADRVQARWSESRGWAPDTTVRRCYLVYPAEVGAEASSGAGAGQGAGDQIEVQNRFPAVETVSWTRPSGAELKCVGPVDSADIGVRIPRDVLAEADAQSLRVGARETGGVLVGKLICPPGELDVSAQVTAMIPARTEQGALTHMTITPETWVAVSDMVRLRGGHEIVLGWWHSHPAKHWCSPQCPVERRRSCPVMTPFFSGEDRHAHTTAFPAAFQTAFVFTVTDDGIRHHCYGWRRGVIRERAFIEC